MNKILNLKVWILADGRIGNLNQAIALAKTINFNYTIKYIEYNCLANLPNFLLFFNTIYIKQKSLNNITSDEIPNIIISSGRRTAALANYLRKKSNNKIQIIQIMHPNLSFKNFLLVILPKHDRYNKKYTNVISIIGALNYISQKLRIDNKKNSFISKEKISILIGGSNKKYKFHVQEAMFFLEIINNLQKNKNYQIMLSFSRRTPENIKKIFQNNMKNNTKIYDPKQNNYKINPYFIMLEDTDYIIATADSISMCSEAASTGKPLYILKSNNLKSNKHINFIEQLIELGIARILTKETNSLEKYYYSPLDETNRISNIIISKIVQ